MMKEEPYINVMEEVWKSYQKKAKKLLKYQKLHKRAYWSCTVIAQLAERLFKAATEV